MKNVSIDLQYEMFGGLVFLGRNFSEGTTELQFPINGWQSLLILFLVMYIIWWAISNNISDESNASHEHALEYLRHDENQSKVHLVHVEEVSSTGTIDLSEPEGSDDLTRIEGIGPKISNVFRNAGINTFTQLANTTPDQLKELLDEAEIRLGDPTTWPEQAKLAADKNWSALKELQDSLKGGRKVN